MITRFGRGGIGLGLACGLALLALPAPLAGAATARGSCPAWVVSPPPAAGAKAPTAATRALGTAAPSGASKQAALLPVVRFETGSLAVGPTSAVLAATVDGRGVPAKAVVQYWRDPAGKRCGSALSTSASGSTRIEFRLSGLEPGTRYRLQLASRTSAGIVRSTVVPFFTLPAGRIPQGVTVGSQPVGRMTPQAALARLERSLAAPVRLTYAGAYWHVSPARVGARIDATRLVQQALTAAPGATLPAASITIDRAKLRAYVATLGKRFGHLGVPSSVKLVGQRAVVTPARPGVKVDEARLAAMLEHQLRTGSRSRLSLPVSRTVAAKAAPTVARVVVVRLGNQSLTAYLNGKPILKTPVTTGRPALPTPVGSYHVQFRASPFTFHSPWPPGDPFWYPDTPVTWAMAFYDGDFLHDDPGEPTSAFGPGSQYGPYASHGCVHVPHDAMAFLYNWLPVGAPVIVAQS